MNRRKLQKCPYCGKDLSQIHGGNHIRWCEKNPENYKSEEDYQKHTGGGWNKGKSKDDDTRIKKQSETINQRIKDGTVNPSFPSLKGTHLSIEHKLKLRAKQVERSEQGLHKGWTFINTDENRRSYPEKWFIEKVLEKYDLYSKYTIKEKMPLGKYFLDFAFLELKLDIEIDGGQHYFEDAIQHDVERDIFVRSKDWKVFRLNWKNITNQNYKELNELLQLVL